jgi:hypothetical protein
MYQHDEDISYFDPEIRTTPDDFRREFKVLSRKKNREDLLELKLDGIEVHKMRVLITPHQKQQSRTI